MVRIHTFTAMNSGLIPGWGTKIPQAKWHGKKKKDVSVSTDSFSSVNDI